MAAPVCASASANAQRSPFVAHVDREIIAAENRLNAIYREIDRHRTSAGFAWREKIRNIEEAEFKITKPKKHPSKKANKNWVMTSARKIRANQANAKASTGPRSSGSKAKAAQNARRHGLSLPVWADRTYDVEAEKLAREIAGRGPVPKCSSWRTDLPEPASISFEYTEYVTNFSA